MYAYAITFSKESAALPLNTAIHLRGSKANASKNSSRADLKKESFERNKEK
jgi:hypothetical protein